MADDRLVQYYLAVRGHLSDGALALLAARAALLGYARWREQPAYRRWHDLAMTKVVLGATPAEIERLQPALGDLIALQANGLVADHGAKVSLLVLPPQPRSTLHPLLGELRLAPKQRGSVPEPADPAPSPIAPTTAARLTPATGPGETVAEPLASPIMLLVAAGDLGLHGGKLAAQCAHAVLLAQRAYHSRPTWAAWRATGSRLALRRAPSATLAALADRYPGGAVRDAGHTQVPAGSLTVVALPPGVLTEGTLPPWSTGVEND